MEDENENEMENGNELKSDIQMEPNDGPIIETVEKKEKENEREHQNEIENEIQNGIHNGKEESVKNKKNVELENQNETKLNGIGNSNGEIEINTIRKSTIVKKKSYQFRALSRKTLSYQKRQWFTNICCLACCPFLMVAICGILSAVVSILVSRLGTEEYYQFCSPVNASNFETGQNLQNALSPITETFINKKGEKKIRELVNFHGNGPCMQWIGSPYPFSFPYSQGPIEDSCYPDANPDFCPLESSSLKPVPMAGWISQNNDSYIPLSTFTALVNTQLYHWSYYATKSGLNVGSKPKQNTERLFPPFQPIHLQGSGLLGDIPTTFYTPDNANEFWTGNLTFMPVPFYEEISNDPSAIDEKIMTILTNAINAFDNLKDPNSTNEKFNYTREAQKILRTIPFGVILFEHYDSNKISYTLQMGTNRRLSAMSGIDKVEGGNGSPELPYPSMLSEGLRRIIEQSKISQSVLKNSHPLFVNKTLVQGLRMMPENYSSVFEYSAGSEIGQILYPFGLSFLLPVFVVSLVKDKEDRILVMMTMNGMKTWTYWVCEYIHFYILHIISTIVFIISGLIFKLEFFTQTDPGAFILFFFIWGHAEIAMAFLLSTFFNRSRIALLLVFCLVLAGVVLNVAINYLFDVIRSIGYIVYPPFAYYRAIALMNDRSYDPDKLSYTMAMMVPGDEVYDCLISLIIGTIVMFILAGYLNSVLPSEYGVQKPWYFIFTEPVKFFRSKTKKSKSLPTNQEEIKIIMEEDRDDDDTFGEDEDVIAERARVEAGQYANDSPIVIANLKKQYPNGKLAVKSVSLAIEPNTVFGLLGPNGAGKTTLISILTGLYPPSSGFATLAGYKVPEDMKYIYRSIGVCPQHDILWEDLTVSEHLIFYARIKGVSPEDEQKALQKALEQVSLTKFRHRLTKGLSGGEKRRLSIAIALIGDPKVVFLDEPTTGLDPEVRRLIWDIIHKAKTGRTIILTTHSMEEAEVLCQRIGIMARGALRCLGPQVRLKNKYGSGFKISASFHPKDHDKIANYLESLLPEGWKKLDNFLGTLSYEFQAQEISTLFKEIGKHKDEYGIEFWGISQTSLEEVFLRIIKETDAEASC